MPNWPVWVRNRQVLSVNGTIWDYMDSVDRLRAFPAPLLGVMGSDTAPHLALIIDELVLNAPHGRVLELPGGHACHIQNMDRFLAELKQHISTGPVEAR